MTIKIDKTIVGYGVVKEEDQQATQQAAQQQSQQQPAAPKVETNTKPKEAPAEPQAPKIRKAEEGSNVVHMHEKVQRPDTLLGSTYKIRTPLSEHSLYVTINDIVLNQGTEHELRRPFEIFINSKNMDHFQWIVALTRIISAVFRKGGDVTFLVDELRSVFDPRGGYFKKGGKYMPSLVAEIGDAIESHLISIGLLKPEGFSEHQQKIMEEKRAEFEKAQKTEAKAESEESDFPSGASLCKKCNTKAVIRMDGCNTCLNCGDSKCG
jgi:FtsZ-interacting cell division protein YlmF